MRILIGLVEIAGNYKNLKKGFERLGIDCTFINIYEHPFDYGGDEIPNALVHLAKLLGQKRNNTPRSNLLKKVFWVALHNFIKLPIFVWTLFRYDVFIFGFNSSFLSYYDLKILKMLNKKIIYIFHGTDSRPPYINGAFLKKEGELSTKEYIEITKKKRDIIRKIDKYADAIVNIPPQAYFHGRPFVLASTLGRPYEAEELEITINEKNSNTITIVHSPSHPELKGTTTIRQAIEALQKKGYNIEFIELVGQPNSVVLENLKRCDFVVDQLYSDRPMAGFATEAAFYGKPAVVGGYYVDYVADDILPDLMPPSHYCHPDEIERAIEKLIVDVDYRVELGTKAMKFVKDEWQPCKVAERYLKVIQGQVPEAWLYDPYKIRYLYGCGISKERSQKIIRNMIEAGGIESLQLQDKPELERLFKKFAYSNRSIN